MASEGFRDPAGTAGVPPRYRTASAYACIAVLACVSLTWFRPGRFIAGGDIAPFIVDGFRDEYLWLWNHTLSGAGSRSFQIASSPFLWVNVGVQALGGSDLLAQRVLLVGLVAATGLSCGYFVGAFTERRVVITASGVLGVFNILVLVAVPNYLILAALALMGVVGGTLLRVADGRRARHWVFAVATVGVSVLALNPPLLAVLLVWTLLTLGLALAMSGWEGLASTSRFLVRVAPIALLLNAWWIVPMAMTLLAPEGSVLAAQTDVVSWSWTHSRSSVSNVLTMTSAWGLAHLEYFPYAPRLDAPPWGLLRFGLPLAAFAAPLLTSGRRRRFSLALAGIALLCIFLGKGLHPPVSGANLWLYEHLPGFWLFREPAAKFGLVQLMAFVALTALTISEVSARRWRLGRGSRQLLIAGTALVLVAMAAFPYPLWTGQVIADERPPMPSSHVAVPDDWREAARFLNRSSLDGKVLVLPLNDYYQMPTTWGYYGADAIAQSLLTAPVLARTGDGYFGNETGVQNQVNAVEQALLAGDVAAVPRLLTSLGVSHVILRDDFDTEFPGRSFTAPDRLIAPLAAVPDLRLGRTFGPLRVYSLNNARRGPVRTYSSLIEAVGPTDQSVAAIVSGASLPEAITRDVEGPDGLGLQVDEGAPPVAFRLPGPGPFYVAQGGTDAPSFRVRRTGSGLELVPISDLMMDGAPLGLPPLTYPLPGADVVAVRAGDTVRSLTDEGTMMTIPRSSPLVVFGPGTAETLLGPFGPVGDCNREDDATPAQSGLRAERLPGETQPAFGLEASRHSACIQAELAPLRSDGVYRVSFDYRSLTGAPARVCIWQETVERCQDLPPLPSASEWTSYEAVFAPDSAATHRALYLYADAPTQGVSRSEYRAVEVSGLTPVFSTTVEPREPTVREQVLGPGDHLVSRGAPRRSADLGPFSAVGDCANSDGRSPAEVGLRAGAADGPDGVIELRARAHSACIWARADDFQPARSYRLQVEYRTERGSPARVCVWQHGPDRCASTPVLQRSNDWRQLDVTVTPAENASGLSLFLYADGPPRGETVVQFRRPSLLPRSTAPVVFIRSGARAVPPSVSSQDDGPARYDIQLGAASGPYVIGLPESYSPGWKLKGLPAGTIVEHVTLDGYANGWRISGVVPDTPIQLVAIYEPAAVARQALAVSQFAAIGLAVCLLGLTAGRRLPFVRELARRRAAPEGLVPIVGQQGAQGTRALPAPSPAFVATRPTQVQAGAWQGLTARRLSAGLLLGLTGLACALVFSPSSAGALIASSLGLAVLRPPSKWVFGAGLAALACGVGAAGLRLGEASDRLVIAALVTLAVATVLSTIEEATGTRSLVPAPVLTASPVGAVPPGSGQRIAGAAPSLVPGTDSMALFLRNRTPIFTMDARLLGMAGVVKGLEVSRILDVGCGEGTLLRHLAQHRRYELHGVDVYDEPAGTGPWYHSADITRRLPFGDGAFDCVLMGDVVEHMPDPDAVLGEARRVLRPGGYLVVSAPNVVCWANRALVPLGAQPLFTDIATEVGIGRHVGMLGRASPPAGHLNVFTHRSLEELLEGSGYSIVRTGGLTLPFPFPLSILDAALSRFPSVASRLLYLAKRNEP